MRELSGAAGVASPTRGFGIMLPVTPVEAPDVGRFAEMSEQLDFDLLGCGEHLMFRAPVANAFVRLAFAAGRTTRIGLVAAVVPLPLYPAALAAKLALEVSFVSGGRFCLGVGVGGEYPAEFELAGVSLADRGRRADEAIDVVRLLATGTPQSFAGAHARFTSATLAPAGGELPIWVSGRSARAVARAARVGDVWFPYLMTPEQLAVGVADLRSRAGEGPAAPPRVCVGVFVNVASTRAAAAAEAATVVGSLYDVSFGGRRAEYLVAGTADECVERLARLIAAGADDVMFVAACESSRWEEVVGTLAADVVPALRGGAGSR